MINLVNVKSTPQAKVKSRVVSSMIMMMRMMRRRRRKMLMMMMNSKLVIVNVHILVPVPQTNS